MKRKKNSDCRNFAINAILIWLLFMKTTHNDDDDDNKKMQNKSYTIYC